MERPTHPAPLADQPVTWILLLKVAASLGLAVALTRYVHPHVSILYGDGGGMENTFFALIFVFLALMACVEVLVRRVRHLRVTLLVLMLGAALCLRFGQHGLMVWLIVEICFGALMRSYQSRSLKNGTPL